ncbi:hypothetical protein [Actinacidiphila paucisporea]|uniref:hypothetical protein n=1 Tax=Actinacidiphila paucisporea TaxID=310782 RepID=UPI001F4100FB|nr:hypothetical protein [Actinacidiphila paucisporea]
MTTPVKIDEKIDQLRITRNNFIGLTDQPAPEPARHLAAPARPADQQAIAAYADTSSSTHPQPARGPRPAAITSEINSRIAFRHRLTVEELKREGFYNLRIASAYTCTHNGGFDQ